MSETNAQQLKRLRLEAVARGLCYQCRCRFPRAGLRICEDCKTRNSRWKNGTKKGITSRRKHGRAQTARRIAARKAAGLCVGCGRVPPVAGYASCSVCLDRIANSVKETGRRQGSRKDGRCCSICGSPNHFAPRHERPGVLP